MSSSQQTRIPRLRFPEFSGEWEEKKLGEITKISQGLQIAITNRFTHPVENSYFYITNEFLKEGSTKEYYIVNPPQNVIAQNEDILMTRTGNTGQVVTGVSGAFHNNFFKVKFDKDEIDRFYLYTFLKLPQIQHKIINLAGSSTIPDLNHSDFYSIDISFPSLSEQSKIAEFLTAVDERIEGLTTLKEQRETYKTGMMQGIFSQEIRFSRSDGSAFPAWEEKKLGEVVKFSKGKGISRNDIFEGGVLECIRYGELYTTYGEIIDKVVSKTNLDASDLVLSEANDVILPSSGETSIDIATASCVVRPGVALGGDLNILKGKRNGVFLSYYLNNTKKYDIARFSQGSSVIHLYATQLKLLPIKLPSLPEQGRIASFLSEIDNKILKIDKLISSTQERKRGLLERIFI